MCNDFMSNSLIFLLHTYIFMYSTKKNRVVEQAPSAIAKRKDRRKDGKYYQQRSLRACKTLALLNKNVK